MHTKGSILFLAACATLVTASDKGFRPPPAAHAKTYSMTETHDDEQVSIAVEPYDAADKTAIFKVKYKDVGFLPVRLIISNDGEKPLMLDGLEIQYVTARRDKLTPVDKEDIYRRISHPKRVDNRLPLPIPRKAPTSISKEAKEEIDSAMFVPAPVMPHSTYSGFLFFDVAGIEDPEAGGHVYVSGIKAATKELFYFDIPLQK